MANTEPTIVYPVGYIAPVRRRMTKLAFRNRFTAVEKATIELSAMHDPTSTVEMQLRSAAIRAFLADLASANYIEPERDDVRSGLQVLEYWGLIGPGRSLVILDTPLEASEKP